MYFFSFYFLSVCVSTLLCVSLLFSFSFFLFSSLFLFFFFLLHLLFYTYTSPYSFSPFLPFHPLGCNYIYPTYHSTQPNIEHLISSHTRPLVANPDTLLLSTQILDYTPLHSTIHNLHLHHTSSHTKGLSNPSVLSTSRHLLKTPHNFASVPE